MHVAVLPFIEKLHPERVKAKVDNQYTKEGSKCTQKAKLNR
jgi:hypothetical protein